MNNCAEIKTPTHKISFHKAGWETRFRHYRDIKALLAKTSEAFLFLGRFLYSVSLFLQLAEKVEIHTSLSNRKDIPDTQPAGFFCIRQCGVTAVKGAFLIGNEENSFDIRQKPFTPTLLLS